MRLSVVLPTYNRLGQLQQVLAGLCQQTISADCMEVIVVSDGSSDGTNDYLRTVTTPFKLIPVLQENAGVATARNNGIATAQGEIILFIDDDVVPAPQLIAEHLCCHSAENIVVLGPMLTPPDCTLKPWVAWEQAMLMKQYQDMLDGKWEPTARQFYTGNTSLGRQHLLAAGGFDPAFHRAEDVELAYRLEERGLKFVFNYAAVGYHYADRSFGSWAAIPYAYGRNDVIFTRNKGQSWLLPTIWSEFHGRHPIIRNLAKLCLDREKLSQLTIYLLRQTASVGDLIKSQSLSRMAYSGIFNLRHYQGVADELGGRQLFFAGVKEKR
jgi:GT2 family glycosyltransferase